MAELNGLIPQILGSLAIKKPRINPDFDPNKPVSDTNVPYMKAGFWGHMLGDNGDQKNDAYFDQTLGSGIRQKELAVAPNINAASGEKIAGINNIAEGLRSKYSVDKSGQNQLDVAKLNNQGAQDRLNIGNQFEGEQNAQNRTMQYDISGNKIAADKDIHTADTQAAKDLRAIPQALPPAQERLLGAEADAAQNKGTPLQNGDLLMPDGSILSKDYSTQEWKTVRPGRIEQEKIANAQKLRDEAKSRATSGGTKQPLVTMQEYKNPNSGSTSSTEAPVHETRVPFRGPSDGQDVPASPQALNGILELLMKNRRPGANLQRTY